MPSRTAPSVDLRGITSRLVNSVFPDLRLRDLGAARPVEGEAARFLTESYLITLQPAARGWVAWCFDLLPNTPVCRVSDFDNLPHPEVPLRLAKELMVADYPQEMTFETDVHFEDKFSGQHDYFRKRYRSQQGPVLLHMRKVPGGIEHLFEVTEYADPRSERLRTACYSVLWDGQHYVESTIRRDFVPDWTIGLSGRRFRLGPRAEKTRDVVMLLEDCRRRAPRGKGFFQYSALSVRTHFNHAQAVNANREWCTAQPDGTWRFKNLATAELDDVAPLLISQHERQHFRQLITSPWGLLIFRIQLLLNAHVESVLRNLSVTSADVAGLFPLIDWYRQSRKALGARDRALQAHLELAFQRIDVLKRFMDGIAGAQRLRPQEFARNANECLAVIEECLNLPRSVRWKESSAAADDVPCFSVIDVVEGAARMHEYGMLAGADNGRLAAEWKRAHFRDDDASAFAYVLKELNHPLLAAFALDAALQGLADPSWGSIVSRELEIDRDHPGERLRRIVEYLLSHWDGLQSLPALNLQMCADLSLELVDDFAAAKIAASVKAARKLRRHCSKEFEELLVEKLCAGVARRGAAARAETLDLVRDLPPVYEIWNDRIIPGDRSVPAVRFHADLEAALLQAQTSEAALGDGVLDEDFWFAEQLAKGNLFGKAIDSQFVTQ